MTEKKNRAKEYQQRLKARKQRLRELADELPADQYFIELERIKREPLK